MKKERWLNDYQSKSEQYIWNIGYWGIKCMLLDLQKETGIDWQPHAFRRTFACLFRKAGIDSMTIKDSGRWESLEMVQRYTRLETFEDSLRISIGLLGIKNALSNFTYLGFLSTL